MDNLVKIDIKTNLGFFLILISVLFLAIIEGNNITKSLTKQEVIIGSEVELIAFLVITLFLIAITVFKPYNITLVAYSAMTLGLITLLSNLFDPTTETPAVLKIIHALLGVVLILSGSLMSLKVSEEKEESKIAREMVMKYRK